MYFSIGSDPEYILTDGDRVVSAIGKLQGTKEAPVDTPFGKVHVDNVAAEINVHPATNIHEFNQNLLAGLIGLADIVRPLGLHISTESAAEFSEEELADPYANRAGCDPDVNAYSRAWNCIPALQATRYRCVGGHIHIGTELTGSDMEKLAKTLDLMVSLPALVKDNPIRRRIYGGAGSFRPKPYGMEYRTPSNNWTFEEATRLWVYFQVDRAVHEYKTITLPDNVESAINGHDLSVIDSIMRQYSITPYPNVIV